MPHIVLNDQNIVLKYAKSNTKEPKNMKTHNKFGINVMKQENKRLMATRDSSQQQRSLIMTMENIVLKIIYDEQNYTSSNITIYYFTIK
jgi:hypothetical protein